MNYFLRYNCWAIMTYLSSITCLFLFLLLGMVQSAMGKKSPPNILFIFADDVGKEVLGCYGGESYQTQENSTQ